MSHQSAGDRAIVLILKALDFAAEKHRNQRRKDVEAAPYINHPIEVARLIADVGGVTDTATVLAALLHDTVEDTTTTEVELREVFGEEVAALVMEVTDDKSLPKAERKERQVAHAPSLSHGARLVKIADKISNIRAVRDNPPEGWSAQRRRDYVAWGRRVVAGIRGTNEALEALFDQICEGPEIM